MRNPKTSAEWQEAVDAAEFYLALDSAHQYGLVEGGPQINVARCVKLLEKGKALGYQPVSISKLCDKFIVKPEVSA